MARKQIRPHGTEAAYKRHHRAGERPCDECVTAHREYQRSASRPAQAGVETSETNPGDDAQMLERARWALAQCERAISSNQPGMAALLGRYRELAEWVAGLDDASGDTSLARLTDAELEAFINGA